MSLTKEDLKAISDLIDNKLEVQSQRIEERFNEQDKKIEERFNEQGKKIEERFNVQGKNIEERFNEQDKWIEKRFDEQRVEFKDMLIDNNLLIAEHIEIIVSQSEERLIKEIKEIKRVTADNCYNIVELRNKIS